MKAPHVWIRIAPFLLALLLGLAGWNANPVSSQREGEGGLQAYSVAASAPAGGDLVASGDDHHIDWAAILRAPCCYWPPRLVSDKILFTSDAGGGLALSISGAEVHDRWTWRYYDPEGYLWSSQCFMEIRHSGDPGNTTPYVALITNCTGIPGQQWRVLETFPSGCPCTPAFVWTLGLQIAGYPASSNIGTWTAYVDYTDPYGVTTLAVAQDNMYLMHTPTVVLIHGYNADCDRLTTLEQNIEQELAVASDRVTCFDYDSRKGVAAPVGQDAPGDLDRFLANFRQELGMAIDEEVDLVGHSMGGLVARYYAQRPWCSTDIGSVSMLGTPNEGVWLAKLEKVTCPIAAIPAAVTGYVFGGPPGLVFGEWLGTKTCKGLVNWVGDLAGFDPDSQAVRDMEPGSQLLDGLNNGFVLPQPPELPQYRAHAGGHSSPFPESLFINPFWRLNEDNDCVVTVKSVRGPNALFGDVLSTYPALTHGGGASAPGCDPPTLTGDMSVVQDLAVTIKGNPGGGALTSEPPAQAEADGPGLDAALLTAVVDYVHPSQANTHQLSLPSGLGDTAFAVYWPDAGDPPLNLGVTLRRPNGQVVDPEDPDVLAAATGAEGGFLDSLVGGFVMSAPTPCLRSWPPWTWTASPRCRPSPSCTS